MRSIVFLMTLEFSVFLLVVLLKDNGALIIEFSG